MSSSPFAIFDTIPQQISQAQDNNQTKSYDDFKIECTSQVSQADNFQYDEVRFTDIANETNKAHEASTQSPTSFDLSAQADDNQSSNSSDLPTIIDSTTNSVLKTSSNN